MDELERSLMLLQNKTRRSILERLVREPHYPMQLAELIGVSQQAIVKHLKELEQGNLVEKMKVPSEKGGRHEQFFAYVKRFPSVLTSARSLQNRASKTPFWGLCV